MTQYDLTSPDGSFDVTVAPAEGGFRVEVDGRAYHLKMKPGASHRTFVIDVADKPVTVTLLEANSQRVEMVIDGEHLSYQRPAAALGQAVSVVPPPHALADTIIAPMPGKVVGALVKKGEKVKAGDPLIILESMKMEMAVRSDRDAEVAEIMVAEGSSVKRGQPLVRLSD